MAKACMSLQDIKGVGVHCWAVSVGRLLDLGTLCQNSVTFGVPQNLCVLMKARNTVLFGRN